MALTARRWPPALAGLAGLAVAPVLWATPAAESDPLLKVLRERGLVSEPAPPSPARPTTAAEVALLAMNFIGVRYRRGGDDAEFGFDCSGFTRHVFEQGLGVRLPRSAHGQALQAGLREVPRTELQPGDLVFFNTLRRAFSHVGIYVGDQRFVHAPRAGAQVRLEDMGSRYWARRFNGARRALPAAPGAAAPTRSAPSTDAPGTVPAP